MYNIGAEIKLLIKSVEASATETAGNDGRPTANHAAHIITTGRLSRYQRNGGGGGVAMVVVVVVVVVGART